MIKEKYKDLIEKEGNALDWNYRGFNCHIRRVNIEYFGYLCGYIEIPKNHILFGKSYDEIEYNIPFHNGINYSGDDIFNEWNIGFSCDGILDDFPMYSEKIYDPYEIFQYKRIYRDMEYVTSVLEKSVDYIIDEI